MWTELCVFPMQMEFVAILVEMSFLIWKFVPAKIGVPILFMTKAEKESFDDLQVNVVCTSPITIRSDSLSTCTALCVVGEMWRQRSSTFFIVIRLEVAPVSRSK